MQYFLAVKHIGLVTSLFNKVWDGVTYSLFFAVGVRFARATMRNYIAIAAVSLSIFIIHGLIYYNQFHCIAQIQFSKYPPTFYYLSYGLIMSIVWWILADYVVKVKSIIPITSFIGRNTLWIYFWHIIYLNVFTMNFDYKLKYLLVYSFSTVTYYSQYYILSKVIFPKIVTNNVVKYGKMLFIG